MGPGPHTQAGGSRACLPVPFLRRQHAGHRHVPAVLSTGVRECDTAEADCRRRCKHQQEAVHGLAGSHAQGTEAPGWAGGRPLLLRAGPPSPGRALPPTQLGRCPPQLQPGTWSITFLFWLPCRPPSSSTNLGTSNCAWAGLSARKGGANSVLPDAPHAGKTVRLWRRRRARLPSATRTLFINALNSSRFRTCLLLTLTWGGRDPATLLLNCF